MMAQHMDDEVNVDFEIIPSTSRGDGTVWIPVTEKADQWQAENLVGVDRMPGQFFVSGPDFGSVALQVLRAGFVCGPVKDGK